MIDKPLYGNPLAGGAMTGPTDNQLQGDALVKQMKMRMQQRDQKTPAFMAYFKDVMNTKGYPTKTMQDYGSITKQQGPLNAVENSALANSAIGNGFYDYNKNLIDGGGYFNVTPPSTPISEQTPLPGIIDNFRPKSDDPLVQGYMDSDFYSNRSTTNVVPYTYQGKEMSGSGSYASNFKKYLDSIGQGDLIQFPDQGIAQQGTGPLATVGPNVGNEIVPYNPNARQGVGLNGKPLLDGTANPYNRVGQQLMGPNQFDDQFSSMGDRLTKLEEGIASLLNKNKDSSYNSMQPTFGFSRYGYSPFSMTGLGSLFGGYYG